jgi:hypothetical protein
MLKKFLSAFLCLTLILTPTVLTTRVDAAPGGISPLWTTLTTIILQMTRSNGTVSWNGVLDGNSTTTSITAQYRLYYKQNQNDQYDLVRTYPQESTTGRYLESSGTYSGPAGYYMLVVSGTITSTSNPPEYFTQDLQKYLS